jgi:WD40 repeat protein/serine/threonine protein kinase
MEPVVPPPEAERIEELIFECLEAMEAEGSAALERACTRHPALAAVLRQRIHALQSTGLIRQRDADEPFPERLGEFRLLRRLGGGGMGVVYLAMQESLGREVALKLIRPEHLYFDGSRKRFQREVEACARLTHPSIVPVYVVGEAQGIPYFAMERIEGASLAEVLAQLAGRDPAELSGADLARALLGAMGRPAPEPPLAPLAPLFEGSWINAVARVAMQVADALAHAHGRGIVHRDIKPSNVMLTPAGRVLLLDFGLAQSEGALRLTRSGSALGSLLYMPPEIVKGSVKDTSSLSDIYSLGVTLYELLTLHPPYQGEDAEATRRRILAGAPRSPRALNRSVPWDVETVCVTAMALEPERRYASVEALGRDLRNVLELKPIEARRPGLMLRIRRAAQRNPTGALALLLLFVLVIVVPSAFALHQRAAREDAERRGYVGNVAAAANSLRLLDELEARRMLDNCAEPLRGWEWHRLRRFLDRGTSWTAHRGTIENFAWAPDQRRLLTAGCDGNFALWDPGTRALLHRLPWPADEPVLDAVWSPDNSAVAALATDGTVRLWETAGFRPRAVFPARLPEVEPQDVMPRVLSETGATLYTLAFSPDGTRIATGGCGNELRILDTGAPDQEPVRAPHPASLRRVLWTRDGRRVITAGGDGRIRFVDADNGTVLGRVLDAHAGGVLGMALSPEGNLLASSGVDRMVRLWELPSFRQARLLTGHTEAVTAVAFDSQGTRLASGSLDGTARLWDLTTGDLRATWLAHGVDLKCVRFTPDDNEVWASGKGGAVHRFACADVDELFHLRIPNGLMFCAEPSQDGKELFVAAMVPAVMVFDARTGERLPDLIECERDLWHLARSPDGTRLAVTLHGLHQPGQVLLVDIARREVVQRWRSQEEDGARTVAFSPDGRTLAFGGKGGPVTLLAAGQKDVVRRMEGHTAEVLAVRFSPDGRRLASASNDRDVRVWSVADGRCLVLRGHTECVNRVEFTPDGTQLVSGSLDKSIRVWDVATGECLAVLEGHREAVRALTFTADGRRLISGSFGGSLLVWDFHARTQLAVFTGHQSGINWLAWSPDQSRLYSVGMQGELRVW